jgi:hypothetical protein
MDHLPPDGNTIGLTQRPRCVRAPIYPKKPCKRQNRKRAAEVPAPLPPALVPVDCPKGQLAGFDVDRPRCRTLTLPKAQ